MGARRDVHRPGAPTDDGSTADAALGPAVVVRVPRSLRALFPGCPAELRATGGTLLEVILDVDRQVPGMRPRLLDAGPTIREHLNVFVNGELAGLDTRMETGAVILVVPAVSGGR